MHRRPRDSLAGATPSAATADGVARRRARACAYAAGTRAGPGSAHRSSIDEARRSPVSTRCRARGGALRGRARGVRRRRRALGRRDRTSAARAGRRSAVQQGRRARGAGALRGRSSRRTTTSSRAWAPRPNQRCASWSPERCSTRASGSGRWSAPRTSSRCTTTSSRAWAPRPNQRCASRSPERCSTRASGSGAGALRGRARGVRRRRRALRRRDRTNPPSSGRDGPERLSSNPARIDHGVIKR